MGLRNLVIRRETIRLPDGQTFQVRGISLFDIMSVLGDFGPQMALVFGKITNRKRGTEQAIDNDQVRVLIADIAKEFPDVLAACIALAGDDYSPEGMEVARQLPIPTQIETVEAIFGLTFQTEGELGKLVESVARMMAAATGALKATALPSGIGGSADN